MARGDEYASAFEKGRSKMFYVIPARKFSRRTELARRLELWRGATSRICCSGSRRSCALGWRPSMAGVLATLVADVRAPTALKPVEAAAAAVPPSATCFAVNAYIYDEDPDRMYVTCRGRRGAVPLVWKLPGLRTSPGAGLSVLDVSEPLRPRLLERWDSPNRLEGQLAALIRLPRGIGMCFEARHQFGGACQ